MTRERHDLVVLGTGPAGASVATRCARAGQDVAIVETRKVGGTCALRGCNPKKVLVNAADLVDRARRTDGHLARFPDAHIAWGELLAFTRTFTDPVPEHTTHSFEEAGVTIHAGRPSFVSSSRLAVDGVELEADQFVIATGARPASLGIVGQEHVATSDDVFELDVLPPRVLFLGGGYVSFELAHVAARAGSEVSIWQRGARALRAFEPDLVDALIERTRGLGVDVRTSTEVTTVARNDDGTLTVIAADGRETTVDLVVHGGGRVPNLDDLELGAADVAHDEHGVHVDEFLRSPSNRRVLAAGDCAASGAPPLTPVANAHAHALAENLAAGQDAVRPDVEGVASVLFTVPPLARVGLSEEDAKAAAGEVDVRSGDWSRWSSVRKVDEPCARYKVLVDARTDRILGAHLLGPDADEVVNLFALAMRAGLTTDRLKAAPLAFPTSGHDARAMV